MKINSFSKLCILAVILVIPIASSWAGFQYEQTNGYVLKEVQEDYSQDMQEISNIQGYDNVDDLAIEIQTEENSLLRISFWLQIYVSQGDNCYFYVYIDGIEQTERIWVRASVSPIYEIVSCSIYKELTADTHTIDVRIYTVDTENHYIINQRYLCVEKYVPAPISANEFGGLAISSIFLISCAYPILEILRRRRI